MKNASGFTLVEVLMATMIFAFSILILSQAMTVSLRTANLSEELFKATQLAQLKMVEMELKYQAQVNSERVPDGLLVEDSGVFEAPNEAFKWAVKLSESSVKLSSENIADLLGTSGLEKEDIESLVEQMKLMLANVNKMIKENYAELTLTVSWESRGKSFNLPIVTHLIPQTPKIQLTTNPDEGQE
jgi:prepilin-type N-terminal cleavage/methylation domain-containing protein